MSLPTSAAAFADAHAQAGWSVADPAPLADTFLGRLQQAPEQGEPLTRRALLGLAAWQGARPTDGLRVIDEAELQTELDAFAQLAHGAQGGTPWTDVQHKGWQRASRALLDSALAQPAVPLHGDFTLACVQGSEAAPRVSGFETPRLGPLTWDLASLLRDPRRPLDEAAELDHAVRYWDALRRGPLPLDEPWNSDFGEFWRACEWTAMLRHLGRLGRGLATGGDTAEIGPLLAWGTRVAMRYRPLQPLASLIEPWSGARLSSGFTF